MVSACRSWIEQCFAVVALDVEAANHSNPLAPPMCDRCLAIVADLTKTTTCVTFDLTQTPQYLMRP